MICRCIAFFNPFVMIHFGSFLTGIRHRRLTHAHLKFHFAKVVPLCNSAHKVDGHASSTLPVDSEGKITTFYGTLESYNIGLALRLMHGSFIGKVVMTTDLTVMMTHEPEAMLTFVKAGESKAWNMLDTKEYSDLIVHDNKFHTMSPNGMVQAGDPNGLTFKSRQVIPELPVCNGGIQGVLDGLS